MILGQQKIEKITKTFFCHIFFACRKFQVLGSSSSKMRVAANMGCYVRAVKTSEDVLKLSSAGA